jgi:hypothetical protein
MLRHEIDEALVKIDNDLTPKLADLRYSLRMPNVMLTGWQK